jgi:hypothetical protein
MTKGTEQFRRASKTLLSLLFTLFGYALSGFGAVLILDGSIRTVSMVFEGRTFVASRTINPEFAVAGLLVALGVAVFVAGWTVASFSSGGLVSLLQDFGG